MIIPTLSQAAFQFARQLKQLYEFGEYDLVSLYKMYLGFVKTFGEKELRQYVQWQVEAEVGALYNPKVDNTKIPLETVDIRTRRGGKSRKLSMIAVFAALLGLRVIWRTPFTNQLDQASIWFSKNPFVKRIQINQLHRVDVVNQEYHVNIGILSPAQSAGLECNMLIFDEGGWVEKNKKLYQNYKECRPFVASCSPKWIIHATTPARYTAVEEAYQEAQQYEVEWDTQLTWLHTDVDCPWITEEWVEKERLLNLDTPWYVDQNYKCKWVVYGGAVFNNIKVDPAAVLEIQTHRNNFIQAGTDFNGEVAGHYLVESILRDDITYILKETRFTDLSFLNDWKASHPLSSLELEDGLFNTQFTDQTKRMGLDCTYLEWNEQSKMERIARVKNKIILIDPQTAPLTYRNLLEAGYDQNSRLPKLEKRTDQHGLDAYLHSEHYTEGTIYLPTRLHPEHQRRQKIVQRFY
jgi:hypothetical protein